MDYPAIKDTLKAWAMAVTGLAFVVFENDPQPRANAQCVYLNVRGVGSVGAGDVFSSYDDVAREITETASGNRQLFVTFQVDSYDMRPARNALTVITLARTRMTLESCQEILREAGLALATISDPVDASYEADDSIVHRYSMDVTLNAVSSVTDVPIPTIETADVSGELLDANGNVLPE